ncbi:unnamed protein product [Chondrus crispus]|uniref:Uncharacterized protein n=1 Tax=Chondrus crispus TaxID=2769 RepID=R7Q7T8_CHOCR|nr:unnamed protein product [Chondrus crispus]CDF33515.1 unnamed protein product [Chondrus crispus]|eukprot:XP_005713318.1 unnamed protein product [Chondrus crispus]
MKNRGAHMHKSSHHPLTQPFADLRMQDYCDEVNEMPEGNDGIDAMDCISPDTVLMRDANTRLYFVSCESCGAKRSVAAIRQGFMARVERRKKK